MWHLVCQDKFQHFFLTPLPPLRRKSNKALCSRTCPLTDGVTAMSSTIHMPAQRLSLLSLCSAFIEAAGLILIAAYTRQDDIEPFGL